MVIDSFSFHMYYILYIEKQIIKIVYNYEAAFNNKIIKFFNYF